MSCDHDKSLTLRAWIALPRIENFCPCGFKFGHIASHDRHAMNQCGGCDECIAFTTFVWHMKTSKALRNRCING